MGREEGREVGREPGREAGLEWVGVGTWSLRARVERSSESTQLRWSSGLVVDSGSGVAGEGVWSGVEALRPPLFGPEWLMEERELNPPKPPKWREC